MYQFTFDEDTTNKIKDKTNKSKTIFEQFSDVDNKYNTLNSTDNSLTLEKIDYVKPSDEEIKNKAENSLSNYKNTNLASISENFEEKNNMLDKSIEKTQKEGEAKKNEIYTAYQNAKENAKEDAIKRGLARSSIIVNTLSSYDDNMFNELSEKSNEMATKISEYEAEKLNLEEQKQNALSSFDIEYAVKLQQKIDDINSEISEKQQEITKYNNEIAEAQAKWAKEQEDSNFDKTAELATLMGKYGTAVFDTLKQNEKYSIAKNYFNSMEKQEAIAELTNNPAYLSNIGRYNYNKLLEELNTRE